MSVPEIVGILIGSGGLIGVFSLFFRIGAVFQKIESSLTDIKKDVGEIKVQMEIIKKDVSELKVQVGKLEVRVEERTLRVIHTQKTGTTQENPNG